MYYQQTLISNVTQNEKSDISQSVDGVLSQGFSSAIYGKIVAIPSELILGNVSTDLVRSVDLWNATTETQTLLSIDETALDGITLTGDSSGTMESNSSKTYTLDISSQGGSTIDALIEFNFSGVSYTPDISIKGSRVILFGYYPDFTDPSITNYQYSTSIQTFYDGSEERFQNIIIPKMSFSNRFLEEKLNSRKLMNIFNGAGSKTFLVPDFTRTLKNTVEGLVGSFEITLDNVADFEVGQFIFNGRINNDYFLSEITEVDYILNTLTLKDSLPKTYNINSSFYPVFFARTGADQVVSKITDEIVSSDITFNIIDNKINTLKNNEDVVLNMFNDKILLDVRPDFQTIDEEYNFIVDDLNNGFGVNERIIQNDEAYIRFSYAFICRNNDDIDYFKQIFFETKGQLIDFWIPSYFNNIKIKQDITATETTLLIENNDNFSLNNNMKNRTALLLELTDGRQFIKEISNFLTEDEETEKAVLLSNFGEDINRNTIRRVEYVFNVRLNSDTLTINYLTDKTALIDLNFKTV